MISSVYRWLGRHRRAFLVPASGLLLLIVAETYVQTRYGDSAVPGPVTLYALSLAVVTLGFLGIALAWKTAEHVSEQVLGQLADLNLVRLEQPVEPPVSRARDRFLQSVPAQREPEPAWNNGTLYGATIVPAVEQGPPPVADSWAGFVQHYSTSSADEPDPPTGEIGRKAS